MLDLNAFYKISYGLYIVCSGDRLKGNGFISNTVFQVTSDPPRFAACCNKNNFTSGFISKNSAFSVSVLNKDCSPDIIGRFGYRSGRDFDKLSGLSVKYGITGVPIVLNECIASLECRLEQTVDTGTHLIFIGVVEAAEIINDTYEPLTYLYYRQTRHGVAPKNAPTYIDPEKLKKSGQVAGQKKFRCNVCGYIYDEMLEGKKFSDLPDDWVCPVCGSEKSEFIEI